MAVRDSTSGILTTYHHEGLQLVRLRKRLSTTDLTAGNQVLLYKFPDVAYMKADPGDLRVFFEDDLDTGATLQWDLGIGDSDGVIDTLMISNATTGRAANDVDSLDSTARAAFDLSGKYLIWNTDASGTTAGDVEFAFAYATNAILQSN